MRSFATIFLVALALLTASESVVAQPQLPSTIYGSASGDGRPLADGSPVRGFIDGLDCTQPGGRSGTVMEGQTSAYVITVMHETQRAGCGKDGKSITFTVNGQPVPQTIEWRIGIQRLDLNFGQGAPIALPTPTTAPAGVSTSSGTPSAAAGTASVATPARPPGAPPTEDVHLGKTPKPPGGSPKSEESGAPVAALLLAGLALVALGGAVVGYLLSRKARNDAGDLP
ncbi:MAG: hypothetical protein ABIP13_04365 [Tepidiformaceae bacterium]